MTTQADHKSPKQKRDSDFMAFFKIGLIFVFSGLGFLLVNSYFEYRQSVRDRQIESAMEVLDEWVEEYIELHPTVENYSNDLPTSDTWSG